jgi:hypothetical protein
MLSVLSSRACQRSLLASFLMLGLGFISPAAHAGVISSVQMFGPEAGTGPGLGTVDVPVVLTLNPNNDNQVGGGFTDNNITVPIKRFDNVGYIDIVFNVISSDGTTEYFVAETVDNDTGIAWDSYFMQLGFGFGAAFVNSTPLDGLDFDAPTYDFPPTSGAFANIIPLTEDSFQFTTGLHSTGFQPYSFRIDVADLPPGMTSFTLRQTPVAVPEPGSLLLLGGLTSWGLLVYRRRS